MQAPWKTGAAAVIATLCAMNAASADDTTAWRLFVSDHAEPVVNVLDAITGDRLGSFALEGPATLHRTGSGETVFAVQGDAGVVSAISTGIALEDHGDHGDIHIDDARLLDTELAGSKPAHFVELRGHVAQWFDGEDKARFFTEKALLDGDAEVRAVGVGAPHHGVAVPFGRRHAVVTIPDPDDPSRRPVGARVVDLDGNRIGEDADCPGLHGSAGSGSLYALACDTGLLLIEQAGGVPRIRHLPYPPSLPEGSASTLIGGKGLQYFVGNYGPDRVVVIDPIEADGFRLVQLPTRRVHFTVDPIRVKFAYVFTEDGQLHRLDVLHGEIENSLRVTDPYSMDGHWSDPRPRVAVAGDTIVVTDPLEGKLHLIDAAGFEKAGEIEVEGRPFNIVAVGGSGVVHGDDDDHAHDHGDDRIYKGYFEDDQVEERTLADWAGDWQSVYPYLQDGTLDPVMAHKAENGDRSADEYRAYYEIGYRTDVERIVIDGDTVTFFEDGAPLKARYESDGHEILTYEAGNRGVRFIFKKTAGDEAAPQFIQFSDHRIAPAASDHYHLYWGDDRAALLKEVTNWPTYYPSSLSEEEIVREMIAH